MHDEVILVDKTALDELRRERRSTHLDLAVELALQLRQLLANVAADGSGRPDRGVGCLPWPSPPLTRAWRLTTIVA